jgi:hypothetical protein
MIIEEKKKIGKQLANWQITISYIELVDISFSEK